MCMLIVCACLVCPIVVDDGMPHILCLISCLPCLTNEPMGSHTQPREGTGKEGREDGKPNEILFIYFFWIGCL
jgi:hypothetical protein